ncbi:hypothetical protein [Rhizohabitans arisaemae]|uniref:hypothetical protein n=1 Tax=Rhizohabitans arisaemae TaxID=2720610 RepID=UPI0024B06EE6|nr:hypothetical protein [Rhizohabitans arisaemae]
MVRVHQEQHQGVGPAGVQRAATGTGTSQRALTLAKIHCVCHAAACAVLTWLHNRERYTGHAWVVFCLQRLLQRLDAGQELSPVFLPEVTDRLESQLEENLLLSITPIALGN